MGKHTEKYRAGETVVPHEEDEDEDKDEEEEEEEEEV